MTSFTHARLIAVLLGLTIACEAQAGTDGRFGDPSLLPSVRQRILILEYDSPQKSNWGRDLAHVLSRQILASITGVPGIGVIALQQQDQRVPLTPSRILRLARQQQSQVVVWGEFYESAEGVYLHSHARVVPDADFRHVSLEMDAFLPGSDVSVSAALPTLQVDFVPIAVSKSLLERLRSLGEASSALFDRPVRSAQKVGTLDLRDSFVIREVIGSWMRVKVGPREGWIFFDVLGEEKELASMEAAVLFVQGLTQFCAGRYGAAERSFDRYIARFSASQDKMNQGMARILHANAIKRGDGGERLQPADQERVLSEYTRAARLLPNSASPVNHLAFELLPRYSNRRGFAPELVDLEKKLIRAIQTNGEPRSVRNLQALYALAGPEQLLKGPKVSAEAYRKAIAHQVQLLKDLERRLTGSGE